jgi:O-antigen/teichoic acid export membrane protein
MRRFSLSAAALVLMLAINAWLFGVRAALETAAWASLVAAVLFVWLAAIAWYVERKTGRRKRQPPGPRPDRHSAGSAISRPFLLDGGRAGMVVSAVRRGEGRRSAPT